MDRERVAKIWISRGLSDLFFAFHNDYIGFENQARFCEIMGLEKFLKAVLLYHYGESYESKKEHKALKTINVLAMGLGHNFDDMLEKLADKGHDWVEKLKRDTFDGYEGGQLVSAIKKGYMETRYPVPKPVSDDFRIAGTKFTHDPLSSSGITKFIYAVCSACFHDLSCTVKFDDLLCRFHETYQGEEVKLSLQRFNNILPISKPPVAYAENSTTDVVAVLTPMAEILGSNTTEGQK